MSFAKVYSAQTNLLEPYIVSVEVDLSKGLNAFTTVGLPDKAVEESRDRVSAAIKNSGFTSPKGTNQKIVVSLAPADIKKEGPSFDLPIALAYLLASEDISFDPEGKLFLGELALDGKVRPIKGALPLVKKASELGYTEAYVPSDNAAEAALVSGIKIFPVETLEEIIRHLDARAYGEKKEGEEGSDFKIKTQPRTEISFERPEQTVDFSDIRGQEAAKRGLEIAAAGRHNLVMFGPPGTGKTLLAKAFSGILPALSFDEILEVTSIHSIAGTLGQDLVIFPPLRTPHHTSSYVALVGGGTYPRPGEITLAHRGVLFLDEFPEFERRVLEAMRQPLEDKLVSITRSKGSAKFPASFTLIAAMNPCPCGNFGSHKACICTPSQLQKYKRKISGPIVDRIDLWVEVGKVDHEKLSRANTGAERSREVRERVGRAQEIQRKRFAGTKIASNAEVGVKDMEKYVYVPEKVRALLLSSAQKLDLSARSFHRVLKLARTIADLEGNTEIKEEHLLEALQYRPKEFFFN